ncbi:sodium:solute symporter [Pseudobacillus sp. 179-B 2D1 NHS]|uniref:sodium:solute symporter n=1 Tax=Pseudobacillus sp. 179-B 2D1 NHS TaxID=3374292 RepID=UPI0038791EE3
MMTVFVFGFILLLSLGIALNSRGKKKKMDVEEYLVGGRSFSGILLFFLAVGEIYSIGTMIGFPGGIYAKGPSYGLWFLGYILLAYPIGYFFAPLLWRTGKKYGAMTIPDLFKGHYSNRGLELVVTLSALLFLIPWGQLQFEGLIVALSSLGFNLSPAAAVIIAGCIAFLYISVSGVKAPAMISILKDILMFLAIIIAGIAVIREANGISNLFSMAKEQGASVTIDQPESLVFSLTTIFFQALALYCMPLIASVIFTGKSEGTIKKTQRFMPLYMLMYPFLILSSYFALVHIPNLQNPNQAFMATVMSILPEWAVGLVAAGAALSGILVLAITSLTVGGLVSRNLMPAVPENSQRKWVQTIVVLYLLCSMALTLLAPSLMLNLINTAYYGYGQFLPGLLAIFFSRTIKPLGIAAGLITGNVFALSMHLIEINLFNINIGLIALVLNFIVTYIVSMVTKKQSAGKEPVARKSNGSDAKSKEEFKGTPPVAAK